MTMAQPNPKAIHRCAKHPDKVQYRTTDLAFDAAERSSANAGIPIYVYACDHCGYFHLSKKKGSEFIGRRILSRADGLLWTSADDTNAATPVERDERFVAKGPRAENRQKVIDALRAHGNPDTVAAAEVALWAGMKRNTVTDILQKDLQWAPSGATRNRRWHRRGAPGVTETPATTVATVSGASTASDKPMNPVAELHPTPGSSDWDVVPVKLIQDLTVSQLIRVYGTMGVDVQIRIRPQRRE